MRRLTVLLLLLASPNLVLAQQMGPERFAPAGSQIYMHWEGFEAHKEAYEKTAVAKMMKGDMGRFLSGVWDFVNTELVKIAATQARVDAELVETVRDEIKGTLHCAMKHGFAFSVRVESVNPPSAQLVLVFPNAGKEKKSFLTLLETAAKFDPMNKVKSVKVNDLMIKHADVDKKAHFAWWVDGNDGLVYLGTSTPEDHMNNVKLMNISSGFFKRVTDQQTFPTWGRGYIDIAGILKVATPLHPAVGEVVNGLGLKNVQGVSFLAGFDGAAELTRATLHVEGQREGLLKMMSNKNFSLADLPALPHDLTRFSAASVDVAETYTALLQAVELAVKLGAPEKLEEVKKGVKTAEDATGVKFAEMFGSFDNLMVSYNASAEGFLGTGAVLAIKVKDAKKLEDALGKVIAGVNKQGLPFQVRKRTVQYDGVDINIVDISPQPATTIASYMIHKDWFVYSSFPHTLRGWIMRQKGDLPKWQPDANLQKTLDSFPKLFTSVQISDPRPTMNTLLSFVPFGVSFANGFMSQLAPGLQINPEIIPNAYEVTRHLFPNVTVTTDHGNQIRTESRSSLQLPF